jgi:hypothetical protein
MHVPWYRDEECRWIAAPASGAALPRVSRKKRARDVDYPAPFLLTASMLRADGRNGAVSLP